MTAVLDAQNTADVPLAELSAITRGRVLLPHDPDFAGLATPWNVAMTDLPEAVVEVSDAADISATVQFAARHGLDVGVRATGHGPLRFSRPTILVHTRLLDEVTVDAAGHARVGAGVKWQAVMDAIAGKPFSALCGSSPDAGVVGYLTGGGLSPLGRGYGYASDYVTAFDVVTGDGQVLRATETENPALFWGLRGGKGALGIVTAVEFDLLPFGGFVGGALYFDGAFAAEVAQTWRSWSAELPESGTASIAFLRLPAIPTVPPPLAGRLTVAVRFTWTGDPAAAPDLAAVFADVAPVLLGGIGPMPFAALPSIHADPLDPMPSSEWATLTSDIDAGLIDTLLELAGPTAHTPMIVVELRQLGGAFAREPRFPSAVAHRDAGGSVFMVGPAVPPLRDALAATRTAATAALGPWTIGSQPNFTTGTDAAVALGAYDAVTLGRLGTLATLYDPAGILLAGRSVRSACFERG